MFSAFSSGKIHEQGREMVRGDTIGTMRDRCVWLPILAIYVHEFVNGTVSAGAARTVLRELTDLPDICHNISSDDTAEPVRDDRDG